MNNWNKIINPKTGKKVSILVKLNNAQCIVLNPVPSDVF